MEIYNECVIDLLGDGKKNLDVREQVVSWISINSSTFVAIMNIFKYTLIYLSMMFSQ